MPYILICFCSLSAPESSIGDASGSKQVDLVDEKVGNSGSDSPPSSGMSENQLPDKKESSSPQNLDDYADIGLVQGNSTSYDPSDSQQQEHPEIPGFSVSNVQICEVYQFYNSKNQTSILTKVLIFGCLLMTNKFFLLEFYCFLLLVKLI